MPTATDIVQKGSISMISVEQVRGRIYIIRGKQVMLDRDLAEMYGVETKNLNKAVKRNQNRFPSEFMFQLTKEEWDSLRSQFATTNESPSLRFQNGTSNGRGGVRYLPFVFTEQGVAMLSAVLHSPIAVNVSISIMKAFVQARQILAVGQLHDAEIGELRARIEKLEKLMELNQADTRAIGEEVNNIYQAINALSAASQTPRPEIGYDAERYKE